MGGDWHEDRRRLFFSPPADAPVHSRISTITVEVRSFSG
jgi:hypothetical protein